MGLLDGRVAIVTGGASGIGARTVRLFVEQGARVVIGDMQEALGRSVADELRGAAVFQRTEVSREDDVRALVARAEKEYGRLDCIFNNAGFGGALGPVSDTPVEEFDVTFAVLVRGVFLGMKHAAPLLCRQGGSVISTASVAGLLGGLLAARLRGREGGGDPAVALGGARARAPPRARELHLPRLHRDAARAEQRRADADERAARDREGRHGQRPADSARR